MPHCTPTILCQESKVQAPHSSTQLSPYCGDWGKFTWLKLLWVCYVKSWGCASQAKKPSSEIALIRVMTFEGCYPSTHLLKIIPIYRLTWGLFFLMQTSGRVETGRAQIPAGTAGPRPRPAAVPARARA